MPVLPEEQDKNNKTDGSRQTSLTVPPTVESRYPLLTQELEDCKLKITSKERIQLTSRFELFVCFFCFDLLRFGEKVNLLGQNKF